MKEENIVYTEHPLRILRYSAKSIWLLLIPMLRGIHSFTLDTDRVYSWFKGSWADLAVLAVIIVTGFMMWKTSEIQLTESAVIHRRGVLFAEKRVVPYRKLVTVMKESPFYMRPFSAVRLSFFTAAHGNGRGFSVIVSEKDAASIVSSLYCGVDKKTERKSLYKSSGLYILLFSVFFSSGFSGAVYIGAFFLRGGMIARDIIESSVRIIAEETSIALRMLAENIPPAAAVVGAVFPLAWFISFVINIIRYSGFTAENADKHYLISCGAFSRRTYMISKEKINYTVMRQNLIMKLFSVTAVNICCSGYSSENRRIPVLMPINRADETFPHHIGRNYKNSGLFLSVGIKGIFTYIRLPLLSAVILLIISHILIKGIPSLEGLIRFFTIMAVIPLIWLTIVKTTACFTSVIFVCNGKIAVKYSCGFSFYSAETAVDNIICVKITRSPFQRIFGRCNAELRFAQERGRRHRVKGLKFEDVLRFAEITGYCIP